MHIRTTTDPMTMRDVPDPESHPCIYEGDGDDGLEIYFETEESKQAYLSLQTERNIVVKGNDIEDYVAEG